MSITDGVEQRIIECLKDSLFTAGGPAMKEVQVHAMAKVLSSELHDVPYNRTTVLCSDSLDLIMRAVVAIMGGEYSKDYILSLLNAATEKLTTDLS